MPEREGVGGEHGAQGCAFRNFHSGPAIVFLLSPLKGDSATMEMLSVGSKVVDITFNACLSLWSFLKYPPDKDLGLGRIMQEESLWKSVGEYMIGEAHQGHVRGELWRVSVGSVPLGSIWETSVRGRQGPGNWAHPSPSSFYSLMRVLFPRRPLGICRLVCLKTVCVSAPAWEFEGTLTAQLQWLGEEPSDCWRRKGQLIKRVRPGKPRPRKERLQRSASHCSTWWRNSAKGEVLFREAALGRQSWWRPFFCLFPWGNLRTDLR